MGDPYYTIKWRTKKGSTPVFLDSLARCTTLCLKSGLRLLSRPLPNSQIRLSKNKNYSNKFRSTTSVLYSYKQKKFPGREWAPKKLVGAQDAFSALYVLR